MRFAFKILAGLALLQGSAFAFQGPEIQVVDGKISMTAQAVPLGQLLSLLDRATGLNSQVLKPELVNRSISVRFKELGLREAVQKIFEGQPLNYILIEGRGIRVTDAPPPGTSTTSLASSSTFPESQPVITNQPLQPGIPTVQPINVGQPAVATGQQANPANNPNNPFGTAPAANANPNPATGPGQATITPGQLPPPLGGSNPLIPTGASSTPTSAPAGVIFPGAPAAPAPQPSGPGSIGGVAPGTVR